MPLRNVATVMCIQAWNTVSNSAQTGDAANLTLRGVGDGTEFTPSAPTVTEMDATNLKGIYKFSLTAAENNYVNVLVGGISSTTGVVLQPVQWSNDLIETALATTARAELAAVPAANASIVDKLTFIEMKIRNEETQSTTQATIKDTAGTVIGTASVTDLANVFTKGKYA